MNVTEASQYFPRLVLVTENGTLKGSACKKVDNIGNVKVYIVVGFEQVISVATEMHVPVTKKRTCEMYPSFGGFQSYQCSILIDLYVRW